MLLVCGLLSGGLYGGSLEGKACGIGCVWTDQSLWLRLKFFGTVGIATRQWTKSYVGGACSWDLGVPVCLWVSCIV